MTDDELILIDLPEVLRDGPVPALFGEGAVAAALHADRLRAEAPALAFLAEIVRRGGIDHAAGLAEPMPSAEQAALVRGWLAAAAGHRTDDLFARWLEAVAIVLGVRERTVPRRGLG